MVQMKTHDRYTMKVVRILSGGAVVCALLSSMAHADEKIAEADMPKYCQGEASAKFKVSPKDISTLPVERDGKQYVVYGQSPAQGEKALFFECRFNKKGKFKDVKKTSDSRAQAGSGSNAQASGGVAVADMPKYCTGEASAKFHQRPMDITTQKAVKDHGMYSVRGEYPGENSPQAFICTFSSDGKLVGVDKQ